VLLEHGGVLVIPTESSYGLAADPGSAEGVAAIYRLKGRAAGKALPVVAADRSQVVALGVAPDRVDWDRLEGVWPPRGSGAVTVVLPIERSLPAAADETTVAVRIPDHAGLRRLLACLGRPLTATSANRSGEPPVLDPADAEALVAHASDGEVAPGVRAVVIDGGTLPGGPPSTIVRLVGGGIGGGDGQDVRIEVLREGAVRSEEVARRLRSF